ncbi:uncharacterized protein [Pyxicephalus adspersus]|uniref:Uncharacterized protein n=1 Tax=Pyxicephalus adspersus TaxID=30357 RepID=A0AAV3A9B1_PYXAD|nr:TPA: hypothetical protein GDO54_015751 [Pyxicephalus adspersus]
MEMNEAFERLYHSIAQDEESIYCSSQNSSTVDNNSAVSPNSASSPQSALEMLTQFSKSWKSESRIYKCSKSVFSTDKKENISLVYMSKCSVDTKSSTYSAGKKQNGADGQLYHEPFIDDSYSTRSNNIEYSYETLDGYESGVTMEKCAKQYLCRECRKCYKKAKKNKHADEEIPKKPGYSHWRSQFWMMINRAPTEKRNKRKKGEQNRTLNYVVRKLRTKRQTGNLSVRCCRIHSFLKRNLRLGMKKKQIHSLNGRQKRKRPTSAQKSFHKLTAERKKESLSHSIEKKNPKKTFVFALDSSEEEDTRLNVKRYKLLGEDMERNYSNKRRESSLLMSDIIADPVYSWVEQNTSEHADSIASPDTQDEEDLGTFNQRFNVQPQPSNSTLEIAGSSVFSHVQDGSFKDLLQRMNSGFLRSGIVREKQL